MSVLDVCRCGIEDGWEVGCSCSVGADTALVFLIECAGRDHENIIYGISFMITVLFQEEKSKQGRFNTVSYGVNSYMITIEQFLGILQASCTVSIL